MTETTELTRQAERILDQAYQSFKQEQLQRDVAAVYQDAPLIFTAQEITAATRQYLFDETIAERVVALGDQVLTSMRAQAEQTEFLKLNFTGNDIRWLLGLPRAHRRQRAIK